MQRLNHLLPIALCCGLLILFYAIGFHCFRNESATIDEPEHALGAYVQFFYHDFRVNPEDPPLWKYWMMLPHRSDELSALPNQDFMDAMLHDVGKEWVLGTGELFETPGIDGMAFINRSRAMMLMLGVLLGAGIALWSWRIAGAVAAVISCVLFVFDPNMLGHAGLLKNDVSLSLVMLCTAWAAWSVGRRAGWKNICIASLVCATGPVMKFSGVMIWPIFVLLMLARAFMPLPWNVLERELRHKGAKFLAAICISLLAALASYVMIWACYGFRFSPTLTGQLFDTPRMIQDQHRDQFTMLHEWHYPTPEELSAIPQSRLDRLVLWAEQHRLLPQGWLYGFLFTYESTLAREGFLLGHYSFTGWWYYFPLAALFKTPLATLAAIIATLIAGVVRFRRTIRMQSLWTLLCLVLPLTVYGAAAMKTNLNLGLRHILPMYPLIYVLVGIAATRMWAVDIKAKIVVVVMGIALAGETFAAFPFYLSFFNLPSKPYRLHLLSDSNFDWGQGLPYVAQWQQKHPDEKLYLGYWASVDPSFYGIHYTNIPGGFVLNKQSEWPPQDGSVVAIGATLLLGVHHDQQRSLYAPLVQSKPREILGDTIYLYDWPPKR